MAREHVVFLAFADARGDLPELRAESRRLQGLFERFQKDGRCSLIFKPTATWDQIYDVLTSQPDNIAIFHFGGHAREGQLLLDSHLGGAFVEGQGLAALLGRRANLKLVFLNGCSTRPQVQRLLDAGVPAIIATARPINDQAARQIAVAFYEALTAGGEAAPAGGRSLRAALEAAQAYVLGQPRIDGRARDFIDADTPQSAQDITNGWGMPWDLFIRPGAEWVERWDLFADDPLFGLPDLPADIGLPDEPFRNLEWFDRSYARIFCGRGRAIRELHDLVTRPATPGTASVLLYYGQTGVGKTSVLAAGLLPRLEQTHAVFYLRRSAKLGLLGTLRQKLAPGTEPFDLHRAWLATERPPDGLPLVVVLDQAEEAYTRPPIAPAEDNAVGMKQPWVDPAAEVHALVEAVRSAFDPARPDRPRGKLILGFRKEWLDEFEKACKAANLPFESVPLSPLDRAGVIEAVRGPASEPDLTGKRAKYRLTIKTEEPPLPELIADDLLDTLADPKKNQVSPIAPTLQILLSRMWAAARERDHDSPTFDRSLYTELKAKGYQLGDVLDEQLRMIATQGTTAIEEQEGLLLDMLEWFTTPLGTAATHTKTDLLARYPSQEPRRLEALVQSCQARYLLAEINDSSLGGPAYRLTHDTLAPLVRERFRLSGYSAQRARRLLENRAADWMGRKSDPVLGSFDLSIVEAGLPWMRGLIKNAQIDEPGLIEASRQAEQFRKAEEAERQRQLREARERELENERRAREQAQAREEAERREKEEAQAREQAERRAKEEAQARELEQKKAATRLWRRLMLALAFAVAAAGATVFAVIAERTATKNEKTAKDNEKTAKDNELRAINAEGKTKESLVRETAARKDADGKLERLLNLNGLRSIRNHDPLGSLPWFAQALALRRDDRDRAAVLRTRLAATLALCPRLSRVWHLSVLGKVHGVAFSPDGHSLAVSSTEPGKKRTRIDVLRLPHGKQAFPPLVFTAEFPQVTYTADGSFLIASERSWSTAAKSRPLGLWRADTGAPIEQPVKDLEFSGGARGSPDGRILLTGPFLEKEESPFGPSYEVVWLLDAKKNEITKGVKLRGNLQFLEGGNQCLSFERDPKEERKGTVKWLEPRTGKVIRSLQLADLPLGPVSFDSQGRWLLARPSTSFTEDGAPLDPNAPPITLIDLRTGKPLPIRKQPDLKVESAVFHPDGARLFISNFARSGSKPLSVPGPESDERRARAPVDAVEVWEAARGRVAGPFQHGSPAKRIDLNGFEFSRDGATLATRGEDDVVRLWATSAPRNPVSLPGGERLGAMAFSPNGRLFVTAGLSGTIRVWDLGIGPDVTTAASVGGGLWEFAAISPRGCWLEAQADDGGTGLWDTRTGNPASRVSSRLLETAAVVFSPDESWMAVATRSATFQVIEPGTGRHLFTSPSHGLPIQHLGASSDGKRLLAATGHGGTVPRRMTTDRLPLAFLRRYSHERSDKEEREKELQRRGEVWAWDPRSGRTLWEHPLRHKGAVVWAEFSADGRRVATASNDTTARVWDAQTGKPITHPLPHPGQVWLARFDLEGRRLLTACQPLLSGAENAFWNLDDAGEVRLWDAATGRPLFAAPPRHRGWVTDASFSPDGRTIATASVDMTARIWSAADGTPVSQPLNHPAIVWAVRYSPDGRLAATGCQDGGIRLWDLSTGEMICPEIMTGSPILDIRFLGGRELIAVNGRQQVVRFAFAEKPRRTAEEWQLAASFHANARIDDTGALVPLTSEQFRRITAPGLGPSGLSDQQWHRRSGDIFLATEDWFAARWHLQRLVRQPGAGPYDWLRLAHAQFGNRDRAGMKEALESSIATGAKDFESLLLHARICFLDSRNPAYRRACKKLVAYHGSIANPTRLAFIVEVCVAGRIDPPDLQQVLRLADRLDGTDQGVFLRGCVLFRAGRFRDAIPLLRRTTEKFRRSSPEAFLFLAMASQKAGKTAEARWWIEEMRRQLAKAPQTQPAPPLLKEAAEVIGIKPQEMLPPMPTPMPAPVLP